MLKHRTQLRKTMSSFIVAIVLWFSKINEIIYNFDVRVRYKEGNNRTLNQRE